MLVTFTAIGLCAVSPLRCYLLPRYFVAYEMDEFDASEVFDIIESEEWRHVDSEAEKFLGQIG